MFQEVKNIPLLKMAQTPVGYLSKTALTAVLAQPDMTTVKGRRNRMIMILLYDTGARVQELVDLRVTDFHLPAGTPFVLVTGKGKKTRSVPLMDKTVAHLKEFLRQFHAGSADRHEVPLFYSLRAGRPHALSTDAISALVKNYGRKCAHGHVQRCRRECTLICFDIAVRCISISPGCRFPTLRNSWDMQA